MAITRQKFRLLSGIFLIVLAVIGWNTFENREKNRSQQAVTSNLDIDFFITDANFKSYGEDGLLAQNALAKKVEHYKQQQKSDIIAPNITQFKKLEHTANINSSSAVIQDQSGKITFMDKVLATSFKDSGEKIFLKTDLLHYLRDENMLSTHTDVEFTDTFGNITTATGMLSDINLGQMKLQSNVKGVFNEE
jgi:LPS export ABC transporter protein LptC